MRTGSSFTCLLQGLFVFAIVHSVLGFRGGTDALMTMNTTTRQSGNDGGVLSKITYAADNKAWVFVNGDPKGSVKNWKSVGKASVSLSEGDVVSIKAADLGSWYGVIADIEHNGVHYGTGSNDWKALKKFNPTDGNDRDSWKLKDFSSCDWPAATVLPREDEYFAGKARDFPTGLNAKYVWASDAGVTDTIFMRFVVGGEQCKTSGTTEENDKDSTITYAADNKAWVFVNGDRKGSVDDWNKVGKASVSLSEGDVVSIEATDLGVWYGFIADIEHNGVHYGTGSNDWKALKKFNPTDGNDKDSWKLKDFSSCDWPAATVLPREDEYFAGKARDFPTGLNAKYVWASDAGEKDTIFMRFVVGGEQCGTSDTENNAVAKEGTTQLSGQAEESGIETCDCKITPGGRGVCWELYPNEETRCRDRDCEDKYECVTNGLDATMTCVRKMAIEKLAPVPDLGDDRHCRTIPIEPTMFYAPYTGGEDEPRRR